MKIQILDSTLRDGCQAEGISMSSSDKLKIAFLLDRLGIAIIETGSPSSNPKDAEFFEKLPPYNLKTAALCAFGATCKVGTAPENDPALCSLSAVNAEYISIVGKCRTSDVLNVLKTSQNENLRMIKDSISYIKSHGKKVIFDAEHFFDAYSENPEYAFEVLKTAEKAGAYCITLCDTNGGSFPDTVYNAVKAAKNVVGITIGIHCHNDTGCAVANSIAAINAGATHLQGTFLGFGERCGNANLSTLIPNLALKLGYDCVDGDISLLYEIASQIYDILNIKPLKNAPYIGESAFAHKAGMHIDAMMKSNGVFEHIAPETVGNKRRYLMSDMSGRSTLLLKIANIAGTIDKNSSETAEILTLLKERERNGLQYETAEASFELFVRRKLNLMPSFFELLQFKIIGEYPSANPLLPSSAMVKVQVGEKSEMTAAEGDGPVHALDNALRRALEIFYPALLHIRLVDYKVRVLESREATAAKVRVLIETTDGKKSWTTVGVSTDIISASMQALSDSIEYKLVCDM